MSIEDPNTWQRHSVILPVALTVADRAITVPNWQHESNPIVVALGIEAWITVTVVALVSMLIIWYRMGVHRSHVAQACVILLSLLMGCVLASNLYVVFG